MSIDKLDSKERIASHKHAINEIKADRIFNRTIDELCAIKGVEFLTDDEYTKFQHKMYNVLQEELER